ncbi:hypothetical protein F5148DRAFT_1214373 [Russula earlei]|uniref:Uncharacterized protein n=1 Tax=Russula earlei TaxID=71964 RepID=A0ACC0U3W9_9AGAM|nr:hypothetical protein F5148DRAFT_1214373 [Russula earlei]
MAWIGLCVVVYGYITFLPIFHKNSPYSAPLSATASFCLTGLRYGFFRLLERYPNLNLPIFWRYRDQGARTSQSKNFFSHSMRETAEMILTIVRCCGRSSLWMKIGNSSNSLKAFLASVTRRTYRTSSKISSDRTRSRYQKR